MLPDLVKAPWLSDFDDAHICEGCGRYNVTHVSGCSSTSVWVTGEGRRIIRILQGGLSCPRSGWIAYKFIAVSLRLIPPVPRRFLASWSQLPGTYFKGVSCCTGVCPELRRQPSSQHVAVELGDGGRRGGHHGKKCVPMGSFQASSTVLNKVKTVSRKRGCTTLVHYDSHRRPGGLSCVCWQHGHIAHASSAASQPLKSGPCET